jgi:hypothetical protein
MPDVSWTVPYFYNNAIAFLIITPLTLLEIP